MVEFKIFLMAIPILSGRVLDYLIYAHQPTLPEYEDSICKLVRDEVNDLRHQDKGPKEGIREKPEVLRAGLEELLRLLNGRVKGGIRHRYLDNETA